MMKAVVIKEDRDMFKRSLALMLAILTVFALSASAFAAEEPAPEEIIAPIPEEPAEAEPIPVDETTADEPAAAASLPTEEVVHERLMAMQEQWPDGTHWDGSSYYVDKSGYREYGCFGFAIMLQEAAFPDLYGPYRRSAPIQFEDVCVGDMLSTPGHTAIVVEAHEDYVVMAEGNMDNGVRWGRTVTAADMGQFQYRWTYYPETYSRYKNGWIMEDGEWFFYEKDVKVTNAWREDKGNWCFLGPDGRMLVGLQEISLGDSSDGWYYFSPKHDGTCGYMLTGWQQIDGVWYYFSKAHDGTYGRMVTDQWQEDNGQWCFLGADGRMLEGLQLISLGQSSDGWYCFSTEHDGTCGHMLTGWQQIDGDWYYFNEKHDGAYGRMIHNQWQAGGNVWKYLGDDGRVATGLRWVMDGKPDDGLYYLDPTHNSNYGAILAGWRTVNGYRYYFETKHNGRYGMGYVGGTYTINSVKYTFDAWGRLVA